MILYEIKCTLPHSKDFLFYESTNLAQDIKTAVNFFMNKMSHKYKINIINGYVENNTYFIVAFFDKKLVKVGFYEKQ